MTEAVSFDAVTFSYPDAPRPVLVDATFVLQEGGFVLVTGPTGAGKSTLLRAINGLVPQFTGGDFSGLVTVHGRDTLSNAPRELADVVAYVPQDPASAFVLDRVEDELAYAMENLGVPQERMRRRVEETLDLLDIASLRDRSVRTLSGGERQRVAIAAALTASPKVLVADEPTSQLDPQGAEDVLAALQRLVHDLGMTVVISEHRLERVAGFADLAVGLRAGSSPVLGAPDRVLDTIGIGPPVARLGRLIGWDPAPLTVRSARRYAATDELKPIPSRAETRPAGEVVLRARGVKAGYEDRNVLNGIDIDLRDGEIAALMGRNGSGKTTLLRTLTGLHPLDAGTIEVGGHKPEPGKDVALCPQSPESVLFKDTALDEVITTVEATGARVEPRMLLERLGIGDLSKQHPRDLSAGNRLLVAVAAMVATDAPVVLLDEPTRGLDPEAKHRLVTLLRSLASRGKTAMIATHDVELVAELGGPVILIAAGEVIESGPAGEVLGDSPVFAPQMARVFGPGWLTPEQVAAAVGPPTPAGSTVE
jgi:energy-coupling factor transporter ATP-binding protein EcfA2